MNKRYRSIVTGEMVPSLAIAMEWVIIVASVGLVVFLAAVAFVVLS